MIVVWLFLAVPWVCLQFMIVVFLDHTHLLILDPNLRVRQCPVICDSTSIHKTLPCKHYIKGHSPSIFYIPGHIGATGYKNKNSILQKRLGKYTTTIV